MIHVRCPECGVLYPYRLGHDCQPKIVEPELVEAPPPEPSPLKARPGKADRVKRWRLANPEAYAAQKRRAIERRRQRSADVHPPNSVAKSLI